MLNRHIFLASCCDPRVCVNEESQERTIHFQLYWPVSGFQHSQAPESSSHTNNRCQWCRKVNRLPLAESVLQYKTGAVMLASSSNIPTSDWLLLWVSVCPCSSLGANPSRNQVLFFGKEPKQVTLPAGLAIVSKPPSTEATT